MPNGRLHYELFPIQDALEERGVILSVPRSLFKESTETVRGTTVSDFLSGVEDVSKEDLITNGWGDYILTDTAPNQGMDLRFVFLKNKTEAQALETVRPAYTFTKRVPWPDWLLTLYAVQGVVTLQSEAGKISTNDTSNVITATRYFDRYALIKGGDYQTQVTREEFFSPTPFVGVYATEPRPMPVFYNYLGMQGQFTAVHEEIFIPEILTNPVLVTGFGMTNPELIPQGKGSYFPPTLPMTGWTSYVREADVVRRDGGYYLTKETVNPPLVNLKIEV